MSDLDYCDKMKPLIEKFKNGDSITDAELKTLLKHFRLLEKLLLPQGERYHFAWRDAFDNLHRAIDMTATRQKKN